MCWMKLIAGYRYIYPSFEHNNPYLSPCKTSKTKAYDSYLHLITRSYSL